MSITSRLGVAAAFTSFLLASCGPAPDRAVGTIAQEVKLAARQTAELFPAGGLVQFGRAIAVDGPDLAVYASAEGTGAVTVFRRGAGGWQPDARFDATAAGYGRVLGLDAGTLVVGSPMEDEGGGAVHLYARGAAGWALQGRVAAPEAGVTGFGRAVAVSGDLALASGLRADGTGAAWVLARARAGWTVSAVLANDDAFVDDGFGTYLALDGTTAAVLAPSDGQGTAYVFGRGEDGAWSREAAFRPATDADERFGRSVAVSGDVVVVGNDLAREAARIFRRTAAGWMEEAELTIAEDVPDYCGFGHTVAVAGDTVVVGAPWATREGQLTAGTVYVFRRLASGAWPMFAIVDTDDPPGEHEMYGHEVAFDGKTLVVSAPEDRDLGPVTGAVYVYKLW